MKRFLFSCVACLALPWMSAAEPPGDEEVRRAILKATEFLREKVAVKGGYASAWTLDPYTGYTEHRSSPTVVSIQPPGTSSLGRALLHAYHATGETACLTAARAAGGALIESQLSSGGWSSDFDFRPEAMERYHLRADVEAGDAEPGKRRHRSTLDDNKTQSAVLLLLELSRVPELSDDEALRQAARVALDSLLGAQHLDGSWPQQFEGPSSPEGEIREARVPASWPREWPDLRYWHYATLNDGNLLRILEVLIRADVLTGDERYLASARRLGDFLLRAQLPAPQPGWAQQYNREMEPAWARRFEPPAVSSIESFGAIEALLVLWTVTEDESYRAAILPAVEWLQGSSLPDGSFARFYELETNRALYCEAETYRLTYDDSNLPTHYGFQIGKGLSRKCDRVIRSLDKPREARLREWVRARSPFSAISLSERYADEAAAILADQRPDGSWGSGDRIEARDLERNLRTLAQFLLARTSERDQSR